MKLIFCSYNEHKKQEIAKILPKTIELLSLSDLDFNEDIEENASTFEGNAYLKASAVYNRFQLPCFADDSGLEVEALNGEPGVYSARYAGEPRDDKKNMDLLLDKLGVSTYRKAGFRTVICLILDGESVYYFDGRIEGEIRKEKSGTNGFGYDPIFEPEQTGKTFAEMLPEEKNALSHRARAVAKMVKFLNGVDQLEVE